MKKNIGLKKIYDTTFKKKDRVRETHEFEEILKMIRWNGKSVLDVGCGTGKLDYLISKKGGNVLGVDYSKSAIKIAKKKYVNPNLSYELLDASKQITGKYDVIVSVGTLEHMDKPFLMLKKFKNHLKPKGSIIITSPNWTNTRGFILMTLYFLLDAPITLADLHYLTPVDFINWSKKLKLNLSWKTIEYSWGNGDKLVEDLRKRLPKIFADMNMSVKQKKINALLKWISTKTLPMINLEEQSGAVGVYIFSKQKLSKNMAYGKA